MNERALRFARCSSVLAMAAALLPPPSAASDVVDVRAVAGLPQARPSAGGMTAWRNFGVVAESDLIDAEVRIATCSPAPSGVSADIGNTGGACSGPSGTGTDGGMGQQLSATIKLPRWHADVPYIDVTVRNWHSQARLSERRTATTGSAVEVAATHALGPLDAFFGYSVPFASSRAQGAWQSAFAGLSWRPVPGTTFEFVADGGRETGTGAIDRTLTLRIAHAPRRGGVRFAAWATRALDDRAEPMRVGLGLDYAF